MIRKDETSYKQTKLGIFPRSKVLKLEVLGIKKGLLFLNQKAGKDEKLTSDFITYVHKISFAEILMDDAGKLRTIQVTYSGKEAPYYSKIAEMVKILCDDTEFTIAYLPKSDPEAFIERVIELLAKFQHRFVFIHPFIDYNGRTARMLTSYILMRLKLPIIEIRTEKDEERKTYIKALQKADAGEYQDLEDIISTALNESLKKAVL